MQEKSKKQIWLKFWLAVVILVLPAFVFWGYYAYEKLQTPECEQLENPACVIENVGYFSGFAIRNGAIFKHLCEQENAAFCAEADKLVMGWPLKDLFFSRHLRLHPSSFYSQALKECQLNNKLCSVGVWDDGFKICMRTKSKHILDACVSEYAAFLKQYGASYLYNQALHEKMLKISQGAGDLELKDHLCAYDKRLCVAFYAQARISDVSKNRFDELLKLCQERIQGACAALWDAQKDNEFKFYKNKFSPEEAQIICNGGVSKACDEVSHLSRSQELERQDANDCSNGDLAACELVAAVYKRTYKRPQIVLTALRKLCDSNRAKACADLSATLGTKTDEGVAALKRMCELDENLCQERAHALEGFLPFNQPAELAKELALIKEMYQLSCERGSTSGCKHYERIKNRSVDDYAFNGKMKIIGIGSSIEDPINPIKR